MMILYWLVAAALFGFAAHQIRPILVEHLGPGWLELACYALGAVLVLPFAVLLFLALAGISFEPARFVVAYLLAFLSFGAGVGVARFVEGWGRE